MSLKGVELVFQVLDVGKSGDVKFEEIKYWVNFQFTELENLKMLVRHSLSKLHWKH